MKRFKYQALITLGSPEGSDDAVVMPGPTCRMIVRAHDRKTGRGKMFSALVTSDQDPALGESQILVTLRVAGDEVGDCLAPGESFSLWREGPVGNGVVTRRLFV